MMGLIWPNKDVKKNLLNFEIHPHFLHYSITSIEFYGWISIQKDVLNAIGLDLFII